MKQFKIICNTCGGECWYTWFDAIGDKTISVYAVCNNCKNKEDIVTIGGEVDNIIIRLGEG